jgi:hypothetical protein
MKMLKSIMFVPMVCGLLSFFLDAVFLLERNSILHINFVKRHEDQIGIVSSGFALVGIVLGLIILKFSHQKILINIGIILSVAALLFSTLGL